MNIPANITVIKGPNMVILWQWNFVVYSVTILKQNHGAILTGNILNKKELEVRLRSYNS